MLRVENITAPTLCILGFRDVIRLLARHKDVGKMPTIFFNGSTTKIPIPADCFVGFKNVSLGNVISSSYGGTKRSTFVTLEDDVLIKKWKVGLRSDKN